MKSIKIIENALGIFEKVKTELTKGIEKATRELEKKTIKIDKLNTEKVGVTNAVLKANKVLNNLNKLLDE